MGSNAAPSPQQSPARRNLRELFRRDLSGKSCNRSGRTLNTQSSHSSQHDNNSSRKLCQHNVSFADEVAECEGTDMEVNVRFIETCETHTEPLTEEERNLYFYTVSNSANGQCYKNKLEKSFSNALKLFFVNHNIIVQRRTSISKRQCINSCDVYQTT